MAETPNQDTINQIKADALKPFADAAARPPEGDDLIVQKGKATHVPILQQARAILDAEEDAGRPYDPNAMRHFLRKAYKDAFVHWSHDELVTLCGILHAEIVLEKIQ